MFTALLLFLIELFALVAYPFYMTLRTLEKTPSIYNQFYTTWTFYWLSFCILQGISWYLDFNLVHMGKQVILGILAAPQLNAADKIFRQIQDKGVNKAKELVGNLKSMEKES